MPLTAETKGGMVVSPNALASQAGLSILEQGGNAVEAIVATAAALCVCYPHMTSIGGDGFWVILPAGASEPLFIDGSGRSAKAASHAWYTAKGMQEIPTRGPLAALTMAGSVSGWEAALKTASERSLTGSGKPLALDALLEPAAHLAETGFPVSETQYDLTRVRLADLKNQPGFSGQFLNQGKVPEKGAAFTLPALARTLRRLANEGLDSFYRGDLARDMAEELQAAGSPLALEDFVAHRAEIRPALKLRLEKATLFNSPAPTQGVASLMIIGIFEGLLKHAPEIVNDDTLLVHALVEATKQAFMVRDRYLADPAFMPVPCDDFLRPERIEALAKAVSLDAALPWPQAQPHGDTVWMGAVDRLGNAVSYIQSIYHEFGSGVVLAKTGVTWQNRGLGFCFDQGRANSLAPGKKPFHTLNPALAVMDDGRVMPYGTMGGEGQPQTQAAVFARHYYQGKPLGQSIAEPRWLLGRAWGDRTATLKLERDFPAALMDRLTGMGHQIEKYPAQCVLMGHAGALVRHPDGLVEGASDPRSDGSAAGS